MAEAIGDPLQGQFPAEVHLPNAPLVRVLTQIRFSEVLSISQRDFIAPFQEAIRRYYPDVKREDATLLAIGPVSPPNVQSNITTWRFFSADENWRLSLATDFVSLETVTYQSRDDFVGRLRKVTDAIAKHIAPGFVTRVGVRYIDRVHGPPFNKLQDLIREEMVGVFSTPLRDGLIRNMSEVLCVAKEGNILARWGVLPKKATHDPDMMPPIAERSWILDLDAYKQFPKNTQPFDPDALNEAVLMLANRAYSFFRWTVRKEFLSTYGGKV